MQEDKLMGHQYQREHLVQRRSRRAVSTFDEAQLLTQTTGLSPIVSLQGTIGNQAVMRLLQDKTAPDLQRAPKAQTGVKPVDVQPVATDEKSSAEVAQDIMNTQLAILEGWSTALDNFDKVMTSESDKAGEAKFKGVLYDFLEDKVVGELFKRSKLPGVGDAFALMNKMDAELKRADGAKSSATLRDFFVTYRTTIGRLRQIILSTTADFMAKVRKTEENAGRSQTQANEYGMMRLELDNTLAALDYQLKLSTPEGVYRLLTEQWLRDSTVNLDHVGWRASYVFIRVEADYRVRDAHIFGTGGQKLAEQLLKDSPGGIDAYSMKVPRLIHYFKEGARGASAVLKLDERGTVDRQNSDGNYSTVHDHLKRYGLQPTTKLEGE